MKNLEQEIESLQQQLATERAESARRVEELEKRGKFLNEQFHQETLRTSGLQVELTKAQERAFGLSVQLSAASEALEDCFKYLHKDIARMTLNESAECGAQAIARKVALSLDDLRTRLTAAEDALAKAREDSARLDAILEQKHGLRLNIETSQDGYASYAEVSRRETIDAARSTPPAAAKEAT